MLVDVIQLRSPGLFDQYSKYCANITVAKHSLTTLLEQLRSEGNHTLEGYFRTCEQFKEIRRQTLADLLDLPRRRLQRYPLLLGAVLKHTSESGTLRTAQALLHATCDVRDDA